MKRLLSVFLSMAMILQTIPFALIPITVYAATPQIVSSQPADSTVDVPVNTGISTVFAESLWATTDKAPNWDGTSASNVFLCEGLSQFPCSGQTNEVPINVSLATQNNPNDQVLIQPQSPLKPSTEYAVVFNNLFTDQDDVSSFLGGFGFTTAADTNTSDPNTQDPNTQDPNTQDPNTSQNQAPRLVFAELAIRGDDTSGAAIPFDLTLGFDQSMTKADVENATNYTLAVGTNLSNLVSVNLSSATFTYDDTKKEVKVSNLTGNIQAEQEFLLTVSGVNSSSSVAISTEIDSDFHSPRSIDQTFNAFNTWEAKVFNPLQFSQPLDMTESFPEFGAIDVPTNTKIITRFNQGIDLSSLASSFSQASDPIRLIKLDSSKQAVSDILINRTDSGASDLLILEPGSTLEVDTFYRLKIGTNDPSTTLKSENGSSLDFPIVVEFKTGQAADTTAPNILWSNPDARAVSGNAFISTFHVDSQATIQAFIPGIAIGVSEILDPTTLAQSVSLFETAQNTNIVSIDAFFDPVDKAIKVKLLEVLKTNVDYTLSLSGSISDLAGNNFSNPQVIALKTSADTDTTAPKIIAGFVDNFGISLSFSESLKETPVKDYTNYTLQVSETDISSTTASTNLSNADFFYDPLKKELFISGISLAASSNYKLVLSSNIVDLSGNAISTENDNDSNDGHTDNIPWNTLQGTIHETSLDELAPKIDRSERFDPGFVEIVFFEDSGISDKDSSGEQLTVTSDSIQISYDGGISFANLSSLGVTKDPVVMWDKLRIFLPDTNAGIIKFTGLKDTANNELKSDSHGGTQDNIVSFAAFDASAFDDGQAPHIVFSSPPAFAFDVPATIPNIQIGFSESMQTGASNEFAVDNPANIKIYKINPDNTETEISYNSLDFDPGSNSLKISLDQTNNALSEFTFYEVFISNKVSDVTGNSLGFDEYLEFETGSSSATIEPLAVLETSLITGKLVSPLLSKIDIFMNQDIDGSSVFTENAGVSSSAVNVSYSSQGSTKYVPGRVEYDPKSFAIKFYANAALNPNTTYTLNVSTSVKDFIGNSLGEVYSQTFITSEADTSRPRVINTRVEIEDSAALGAFSDTAVAGEKISGPAVVFVQFDKTMGTSVEEISNYTLLSGTDASSITTSLDLSSAISDYNSDFNELKIWGADFSVQEGDYFKLIVSENVKDLGANVIDTNLDTNAASPRDINGQSNPFNQWEGIVFNPFKFKEPLDVIDSSPFWGAQDVPTNAKKLMVRFNRQLKSSTVSNDNIKLYTINEADWSEDAEVSLDSQSPISVHSDQKTINILAAADLEANKNYRLIVGLESANQNIEDNEGIPLEYPTYIEFKTSSLSDTSSPTKIWHEIAKDDSGNVFVGLQNIAVGMSEAMDIATITKNNILLFVDDGSGGGTPDDNAVNGSEGQTSIKVNYDPFANIINIQPQSSLSPDKTYSLILKTGLTDVAGNALTETEINFQTSSADTLKPQLLAVYADDFGVFVQYSEPVKESAALNSANYTFLKAKEESGTSYTTTLDASGQQISLASASFHYDPHANGVFIEGLSLNSGEIYRLTVSDNLTDLSGNSMDTSTDSDGAGPHPDNLAFNVFEGAVFTFTKDEIEPRLLRAERLGPDLVEIIFDEPSGLSDTSSSGKKISLNSDVITLDSQTLSAAGLTIEPILMWDRIQLTIPESLSGTLSFNGLKDNENNILTSSSSGGNTVDIPSFNTQSFDNGESPYIIFTTPQRFMFDAPVGTKIKLGFNKLMKKSSVEDSANVNIYLDNEDGTWSLLDGTTPEGAVTRSYDSITNELKISFANGLQTDKHYEIAVKASVSDLADRVMGFDDVFEFWTAAAADNTKPTIVGNSIQDATKTPVMIPAIDLFLSEDIDGSTVFTQNAGESTSTVNLSYSSQGTTKYVPGEVMYDPMGWTIRFFPREILLSETQYTLKVSTNLKDLSGNAMDTVYKFNFTTGSAANLGKAKLIQSRLELEAEALTNAFADVNATEASGGARLFVQFDRPMTASEVEDISNYKLYKGPSSSAISTEIDLTNSSIEYYQDYNEVEIWGGDISVNESDYYKVVVATTMTDIAGTAIDSSTDSGANSPRSVDSTSNSYNEWEGKVFSPFKNDEGLFVIEASPEWGAYDVPQNAVKMTMKFNKKLKSSSLSTSNVKLYTVDTNTWVNGSEVTAISVSLLDDQQTVVIEKTDGNFDADTSYRLILGREDGDFSNNIQDSNGFPLQFPIYIEFQTSSVLDSAAPSMLWREPDAGQTDVPTSLAALFVGFTEALDPATITTNNLKLIKTSDSSEVPIKLHYDPYSFVVEINPQKVLEKNTQYAISVAASGITDKAGNVISAITSSFTTVNADDTTSPQILSAFADDFGLFVQYTEPVKEVTAVSKSNYTILKTTDPGNGQWTTALNSDGQTVSLKSATLNYDPFANGVFFEDLDLAKGEIYRVTASNIKDLADNSIDTSTDSDGTGPHPDSLAFNVFDGSVFSSEGFKKESRVSHAFPFPGEQNVPNTIDFVGVGFTDEVNKDTITASTVYILPINSDGTSGTKLSVTPTYDSSTNEAVFNLSSTLTSPKYRIVVTRGVKDKNGEKILPFDPLKPDGNAWESEFTVSSSTDTLAPTLFGTSLDAFESSGSITNVPLSLGAIKIMFSEGMKESTIKDLDISNALSSIYIDDDVNGAGTKLSGRTEYNPQERAAKLILSSSLAANTSYYLHLTTGVTDIAGNSLGATETIAFTTTAQADNKNPVLAFAEADNYEIRLFFSEAVKKKLVETKKNISIESPIGVKKSLDDAKLNYDEFGNILFISGLRLEKDTNFLVTVSDRVTDLSGNSMETKTDTESTDDSSGGTNASIEFDPFSYRDLGSSGRTASKDDTQFNQFEGYVFEFYDEFAETIDSAANLTDTQKSFQAFNDEINPAKLFPWNDMAGETTKYGVDFTALKAIPVGAKIQIKFPEGFDVSNAALLTPYDPANPNPDHSFVNSDINGPASGTITVASLTANKSSRTISFITAGAATNAGDFITIDLGGIVNTSVPKEYGTDGYKGEINIINTDSKKLEGPIFTESFFIKKKGNGQITGTVTGAGASGAAKIYIESERIGFIEKDITFNAGSASYSFDNLPYGEYRVFMDGFTVVGASEYQAPPMTQLKVENATPITYNFGLKDLSAAQVTNALGAVKNNYQATVNITGGPASKVLYWHIGNPENGHFEKSVTLDASGAGTANIKVPEGFYFTTIDTFSAKSTNLDSADLSFIPPEPLEVDLNGQQDSDETAVDTFTIDLSSVSADNYLTVSVVDTNANKIPNANISVSDPFGIQIPPKKTGADGTVSFKLPAGDYLVSGKVKGLVDFPSEYISVSSANNQGSPALHTFTIKVDDNKISGKVLNGSTTLKNTPVMAQRVVSKTDNTLLAEFLNTQTDENGEYAFFVPNNTVWKIFAYVEGYGETDSQIINPSTDTLDNVNLSVNTSLSEITGTIQYNGTALTDVNVFAETVKANGDFSGNFFNDSFVDKDGKFTLRLKNSSDVSSENYLIAMSSPSIGYKVISSALTVSASADIGTTNITDSISDITFNLKKSDGSAYTASAASILLLGSNGEEKFVNLENKSTAKVSVLAGTYTIDAYVEGVGELTTLNSQDLSSSTSIDLTIPTATITISGTVSDESSAAIEKAVVRAINTSNGFESTARTDASGNYSIVVPSGQTYSVSVKKSGYIPPKKQDLSVTSDTSQDFSLKAASSSNVKTVSGTVTLGSDTSSNNAFVWAENSDGKWIGAKVNTSGVYSLKLEAGEWTMSAKAEGYLNLTPETVNVSASDISKDITLSSDPTFQATKIVTKPITPSNGGVVNNPDTGMSVSIPAQAMGSSTSSGSLKMKETTLLPSTTDKSVAGKVVEFEMTDNDGNAITNFNSPVQITIDYSDYSLSADDKSKLKCSYFDEAINDWISLATTNDTTNEKLKCTIDHFTPVGATSPSSTSSSTTTPSTTTTSSGGSGGGGAGGSGPDTSTPFKLTSSETTKTAHLVRPLDLEASEGLVNRPIVLKNYYRSYQVDIAKDTKITYEDGSKFTGNISVPEAVSRTERPVAPTGFQTAKVVKVGSDDGKKLKFSKPFTLTIPVSFTDTVDAKRVKVYHYDPVSDKYELLGGELNNDQTEISVEVDHMSMFAVLYAETDINTEIQTLSSGAEISAKFKDLDKHWARSYIDELTSAGVFKNSTKFRPNDGLLRAELVKILVEAYDLEFDSSDTNTGLKDVDPSSWYAPYVKAAIKAGVVKGYSDLTFKPGALVNRAEALKMIVEANPEASLMTGKHIFDDVESGAWYEKYIVHALYKGIANGKSRTSFAPGESVTRAEIAKMVYMSINK